MKRVRFFTHETKSRAKAIEHLMMNYLINEHGGSVAWGSSDVDLVVAIGGDGTVLQAAEFAAVHDIPVMGVNLGEVGYLADVSPDNWRVPFDKALSGFCDYEPRMGLSATGNVRVKWALNDIVIEKTGSRAVKLAVSINGQYFTTYTADGVIVSTATGSTGYSLSAGGPIVAPRTRTILLTPVAPTSLFNRTIVLDCTGLIEIQSVGWAGASISADGKHRAVINPGEEISITSGGDVRFCQFNTDKFHVNLKNKFNLE